LFIRAASTVFFRPWRLSAISAYRIRVICSTHLSATMANILQVQLTLSSVGDSKPMLLTLAAEVREIIWAHVSSNWTITLRMIDNCTCERAFTAPTNACYTVITSLEFSSTSAFGVARTTCDPCSRIASGHKWLRTAGHPITHEFLFWKTSTIRITHDRSITLILVCR
jgi:hypothetical protein